MHKVHRPGLVQQFWNRQGVRFVPYEACFGFDAQIELQFPINAVDPLVIPTETFHIAQKQKTEANAPIALIVGQSDQPVGDPYILRRQFPLTAKASIADLENTTGKPYAD